MPDALRLALIASTCAPYARDAGRADVVAALADAVARRGHDVTLFLPAHRDLAIPADAIRETLLAGYPVPMGEANEPASLIRITRPGQPFEVLLVQHRGAGRWFDRPGFAPADDARAPREAFFARAALEGLRRLDRRVDLVHAFDAPAAWAPAYLRRAYAGDGFFARTGCLFSVLDWSDAPTEPAATVGALGLGADAEDPWSRFTGRDGVPVLALALRHADRIVFPRTGSSRARTRPCSPRGRRTSSASCPASTRGSGTRRGTSPSPRATRPRRRRGRRRAGRRSPSAAAGRTTRPNAAGSARSSASSRS
jgi:glycogen synthase